MAKKTIRAPARQRSRPYRGPGPRPAAPADPDQLNAQEQLDWSAATGAANDAEQALRDAEGAIQSVAWQAEQAEITCDAAVRAAEQAEEAAKWALVDAERLVSAARARVEAARALARAGRQVAADALEGEWEAEQADPDDVPFPGPPPNAGPPAPPAPPFEAARRAMAAASRGPSSRRYN